MYPAVVLTADELRSLCTAFFHILQDKDTYISAWFIPKTLYNRWKQHLREEIYTIPKQMTNLLKINQITSR